MGHQTSFGVPNASRKRFLREIPPSQPEGRVRELGLRSRTVRPATCPREHGKRIPMSCGIAPQWATARRSCPSSSKMVTSRLCEGRVVLTTASSDGLKFARRTYSWWSEPPVSLLLRRLGELAGSLVELPLQIGCRATASRRRRPLASLELRRLASSCFHSCHVAAAGRANGHAVT